MTLTSQPSNDSRLPSDYNSTPTKYESSLLLLGSYIIALLLTTAVHEVGHALALVSISINFQLVLNPFSLSMARPLSSIPSASLLFVTSAGTIAELLFGAIVGAAIWQWRSPKLTPLLMSAPIAFLSSAGYFLAGTGVAGSDVIIMISSGVPAILLQVLGVLLVILGAIAFILLFPLLGISPDHPFSRVFSILFIGLTLHGIGMIAFALAFNPSELYVGIANVISMTITTILLASVYVKGSRTFHSLSRTAISNSDNTAIYSSIGLATLFIVFELIFFS
ncbi:MAG: hypothetical protein ACFFFC_06275 [Candidatus Thorarchaeota archaeon]